MKHIDKLFCAFLENENLTRLPDQTFNPFDNNFYRFSFSKTCDWS